MRHYLIQYKKLISLMTIFISLIFVATQFQNCSDARFTMVKDDNNGSLKDPDTPVDPPVPTKSVKLHFKQPERQITNQLDLLFVADTSISFQNERSLVASSIEAFIQELPANSDINIGVLLAHGSQSPWTGRLYRKLREPLFLNTKIHTKAEIIENLRLKMLDPSSDDSDGGEMGLYSLTKYLEKKISLPLPLPLPGPVLSSRIPDSAPGKDDFFIRQNAGLAVVFISDENDICATYPTGIRPVKDPSGREDFVKDRDCYIQIIAKNEKNTFTRKFDYITATNTHNLLKKVKGDSPLIVTGLLYTNPENVPLGNADEEDNEDEVGYGYLDVIALNNDIPIDLTSNIKKGLEVIGQLVYAKLNLLTSFNLDDPLLVDCADQVMTQSINVKVDAKPKPFQFLKESCEVQIDLINAGEPGSSIEIDFTFKITNF